MVFLSNIQEYIHQGVVSLSLMIHVGGEIDGEFTAKHVAEAPQVLKPAVLSQVLEGVIISLKDIALQANIHEEGLAHQLQVPSLLRLRAPVRLEVMKFAPQTLDV